MSDNLELLKAICRSQHEKKTDEKMCTSNFCWCGHSCDGGGAELCNVSEEIERELNVKVAECENEAKVHEIYREKNAELQSELAESRAREERYKGALDRIYHHPRNSENTQFMCAEDSSNHFAIVILQMKTIAQNTLSESHADGEKKV